jgi:hypothetical protein
VPLPQPPGGPTLRRRTALGLLVLSGSAACTTQAGRPAGGRTQGAAGPAADPDVTLASTVLAAERAVLDRVRATAAAHPPLAVRLAATAAVHARHVRLLTRAVPPQQRSASPSPSPSTSASTPAPPVVPHGQAKALQALARAEDDLCASGKQAAFTARSGEFARLLASMAAAAAQQAAVLRAPVRAGGAR